MFQALRLYCVTIKIATAESAPPPHHPHPSSGLDLEKIL